jgi:exoribonuclease-2
MIKIITTGRNGLFQTRAELEGIHGSAARTEESTRDLGSLLCCAIDNDDGRDLDQLSVAEALPDGTVKRWVRC